MEENKNQYEQVLSRVLSPAPCSVVLSPRMNANDFEESFLSAYEGRLLMAKILPVRFNCAPFLESIAIWKGIVQAVKVAMPRVYNGNTVIKKSFESIEKADTTEGIKRYLNTILSEILKNSGWTILLILEDFENIVDRMKEHDLMKIRGMTTSFIIMTISYTGLKKLVDEKYEHAYFCNQFMPFKF